MRNLLKNFCSCGWAFQDWETWLMKIVEVMYWVCQGLDRREKNPRPSSENVSDLSMWRNDTVRRCSGSVILDTLKECRVCNCVVVRTFKCFFSWFLLWHCLCFSLRYFNYETCGYKISYFEMILIKYIMYGFSRMINISTEAIYNIFNIIYSPWFIYKWL